MHWIIQNNIYSEDGWEKLVGALERLGCSYSIHKCIPFVGTLDPEPTPPPGPVIVMGSYTLAREAKRRGWVPGVYLNDNFNTATQIKHWGTNMLNSRGHQLTLEEVELNHLTNRPFFIRPVDDSKSFTGCVMDWDQFSEWRHRLAALTPEDNPQLTVQDSVVISPVQHIVAEYRTWIVNGKVVTASQYKSGTMKAVGAFVPPEVISFANARASEWNPATAYVMDVCYVEDGSPDWLPPMKIVEVNNLNSAGFYAADMNKLVQALEELEAPDSL